MKSFALCQFLCIFALPLHPLRSLKIPEMTIQIKVGDRNFMFRLDWKHRRWHSLEEPEEADFPLVIVVEGKRYELYSDGTFDEVEK
jgi:hypothetical protein